MPRAGRQWNPRVRVLWDKRTTEQQAARCDEAWGVLTVEPLEEKEFAPKIKPESDSHDN